MENWPNLMISKIHMFSEAVHSNQYFGHWWVNCLEVWLSPQISWFRWPGESPGRRCMSEVKPGEFSITNLAIRSWDPVLWCNFVWVCLGWRNFTFQMDGSDLPYESIRSFHLNLAEVPSKFHTISQLNGSQFAEIKCQNAEPLEPAAVLRIAVRAGDGADFPWGNRVERCCFSWRGWDALGSSGEGPSEKWMWLIPMQHFFPTNGEGTEQVWNWW